MNSPHLAQALSGPRESLEAAVAALEGVPYALSYANTSAALHTLSKLLYSGERVLIDEQAPPLLDVWTQMGLAVERVPLLDLDLAHPTWNGVRMVWTTRTDQKLLEGARVQGALTLLDSTLEPGRGPCGADLIYYGHSAALSGHGDLAPSLLATRSQALFEELSTGRIPPGPLESLLALGGTSTLNLRLERSRSTADLLFSSLERHPAIVSIERLSAGVLRLELRDPAALYNLTLFGGMQLGASESAYQVRGDYALLSIGIEEPRLLLGDLIAALATHGNSSAPFEVARSHPTENARQNGNGGRSARASRVREERRIVTPPTPAAEAHDASSEDAPEPYYAQTVALETRPEAAPLSHTVPADEFLPDVDDGAPEPDALRSPSEAVAAEGALEVAVLTPASETAALAQNATETPAAQGFDPAKQDPAEDLTEDELRRYNRLRDWRNAEAKKLKVSTFIIASNATLAGVARRNPHTLEELREVRGMGKKNVEQYGQAMLGLLAQG